ncbi:MAG: NUDIX domain-containing protein [Propionibacterium sp.]|nr:NUDIX domain-containing protein [Propionibacterium sp.]
MLRPGDTGQQVLLGKRSDSGRWSSIDGIVEPGEAPEETAVRECLEETELAVEVERLVMTGVLGPIRYPNGDVCSFVDHVFRCHVTWTGRHRRPGEHCSALVRRGHAAGRH